MKQLTTLKEWKLLKETISKYKLILESAEGEVINDLIQWKQLMADKYDSIEFVDSNDTIAAYNTSELVGHFDILLNKGIIYDMNLTENASKHKGININIKEFKHLYHKSNPHFRSDILKNGLIIQKGESYKLYSPENNESPAIFAYTDDIENYDTTYDDDVYEISLNNKNEWFIDNAARNAIVTYSNIPVSDIKLVYKGTGESY